jgi:hypothetical protein
MRKRRARRRYGSGTSLSRVFWARNLDRLQADYYLVPMYREHTSTAHRISWRGEGQAAVQCLYPTPYLPKSLLPLIAIRPQLGVFLGASLSL